MTHVVSDGLKPVRAAGQKVREGAGAAATSVRGEAGAAVHGVHEGIDGLRQHAEHPAAHKPVQPAWKAGVVELAVSAAGALAAFFVRRLVRAMFRRHGE